MRATREELAEASIEVPKPKRPAKSHDVVELFKPDDPRIAVIVGSGTSLRGFRFSDLNDSRFVTFAINEEAWNNRDAYFPDFWIFGDDHVGMKRWNTPLPPRTRVLTKDGNLWKFSNGRPMIWLDKTYGFGCKNDSNWSMNVDWVPCRKTTATAAVALAAKMGFKRIILLGIDCYASRTLGYYHDGRPKQRTEITEKDGDLYQTVQHREMMKSWKILAEGFKRYGWNGKIYQTSFDSPIPFWQKRSWMEAVKDAEL